MMQLLPVMLVAASFALQQSTPNVPSAATPAGAPLPSKGKLNAKGVNSELAGRTKEDGVLSFARYEGGSLALKPNRVTTYINQKEVVLVQGKQRFAIPIPAVSEVLEGNGVAARVRQDTGGQAPADAKPAKPAVVGIVWKDGGNKDGIALLVDKDDFDAFVWALETVTGLKVSEAR
ncbi:MAG TPA: hypothetical protein VHW09_15655 [Bryobacteraceae bacterium]|jgi:hypothetical protein|nr:hypothetical protein [Bryobacteraceae bacterium]